MTSLGSSYDVALIPTTRSSSLIVLSSPFLGWPRLSKTLFVLVRICCCCCLSRSGKMTGNDANKDDEQSSIIPLFCCCCCCCCCCISSDWIAGNDDKHDDKNCRVLLYSGLLRLRCCSYDSCQYRYFAAVVVDVIVVYLAVVKLRATTITLTTKNNRRVLLFSGLLRLRCCSYDWCQ